MKPPIAAAGSERTRPAVVRGSRRATDASRAFATEEAPATRRSTASVAAQSRTATSRGEASRRRHRRDGRVSLVSGKHRKHRRYSRRGPIGPPSFVSAQEHTRTPIGSLGHVARRHRRFSLRAQSPVVPTSVFRTTFNSSSDENKHFL